MFIIDDKYPIEHVIDSTRARGLIPRNYTTHPVGFYSTIPAADIDAKVLSDDEIVELMMYKKEVGDESTAGRSGRASTGAPGPLSCG